jgi:hypothetical protein
LSVGGCQIDAAVAEAFLAALAPAALEATLQAAEQLEASHQATIEQSKLDVERIRYRVQRAERRYRAVDAENRLVARGLEAEWEEALRELKAAEAQLQGKEKTRPRVPTPEQRAAIGLLGHDLDRVWSATTTTDRDRKELLHALLEEVIIALDRANYNAQLTLRRRAGLFSEIDVALPRSHPAAIRTTPKKRDR